MTQRGCMSLTTLWIPPTTLFRHNYENNELKALPLQMPIKRAEYEGWIDWDKNRRVRLKVRSIFLVFCGYQRQCGVCHVYSLTCLQELSKWGKCMFMGYRCLKKRRVAINYRPITVRIMYSARMAESAIKAEKKVNYDWHGSYFRLKQMLYDKWMDSSTHAYGFQRNRNVARRMRCSKNSKQEWNSIAYIQKYILLQSLPFF